MLPAFERLSASLQPAPRKMRGRTLHLSIFIDHFSFPAMSLALGLGKSSISQSTLQYYSGFIWCLAPQSPPRFSYFLKSLQERLRGETSHTLQLSIFTDHFFFAPGFTGNTGFSSACKLSFKKFVILVNKLMRAILAVPLLLILCA